jgi:hypothetical protein
MSHPSDSFDEAFDRRGPFLVAAVMALAILVRLPDFFGWWPNPDEGIYYGVVTRTGFATAWAEAWGTAHPPLYFLVLRGVGWLSTDFAALRSVAFASACIAVYVFVLVGREIGGPGAKGQLTGLVAGLLLALSPRAVVLSQVMRPYMMLVLLLASSLLLLLRYLRAPSTRLLLAHSSCALLAALLHYSAVFGLAVTGALVLFDGIQRGRRRSAWRRLTAAQAVPALALVTLYFVHLRGVAAGPLGAHALDGWLAPYMIAGPLDAWFAFVGFHSMLVGNAWAAPAALFTVGTMAYAVWRRSWSPIFVMTATGFALGGAGAVVQVYPFGPTRHTAWLLVFVIPAVAWTLGELMMSGRVVITRVAPLVVLGLVGAKMLGPFLDPEDRPREISEHVLLEAAVVAMADVLDPQTEPPVVLMSTETYELLTPLYAVERLSAERSRDGELLRFRWGARDVIVLPSRDFVSRPEELLQVNHLYTAARFAEIEFGVTMPRGGDPVLVLSGGWRSQGMADLVEVAGRAGPLGTTTSVPGLVALFLDLDAYGRALGDPSR